MGLLVIKELQVKIEIKNKTILKQNVLKNQWSKYEKTKTKNKQTTTTAYNYDDDIDYDNIILSYNN